MQTFSRSRASIFIQMFKIPLSLTAFVRCLCCWPRAAQSSARQGSQELPRKLGSSAWIRATASGMSLTAGNVHGAFIAGELNELKEWGLGTVFSGSWERTFQQLLQLCSKEGFCCSHMILLPPDGRNIAYRTPILKLENKSDRTSLERVECCWVYKDMRTLFPTF